MNSPRQTAVAIVVSAIVLTAASAAAGYWFARRGGAPIQATTAGPSSNKTGKSRKPLYWYDPMQPNQHFDKPGKSPFMEMQLVPRYGGETSAAGEVRVSPNTVQNLGIRIGHVERLALASHLRAVGSVVFDERLLELVQARVEGSVTQLLVKAPFERVRRG